MSQKKASKPVDLNPVENVVALRRKYIEATPKAVALYHRVYSYEDFDTAAQHLFEVLQLAVREHPGKPRILYLDIEGHRNSAGGFDHDMYELQQHFVLQFLGPFLSRINCPLIQTQMRDVAKQGEQSEDLPEVLQIGQQS